MFAREGCAAITIAHLAEETPDAMDAKATIEAAGAQVELFSGDLMQEAQCRMLVETHMRRFGKLDVLVNNASKQM